MSEPTMGSILPFRPRHVGKAPFSVRAIRHLVRDVRDGADVDLAIAVLAASYVDDGKSLEALYEHLDELLDSGEVSGADERTIRLAAMAWAEACVSRFTRVTCADPMTGLAPVEHLIDVLTALFRQSAQRNAPSRVDNLSFLIVDLWNAHPERSGLEPFGQALRLAQVADSIDGWFADAPLAKVLLGPDRVAVLVPVDGMDVDVAAGFGADLTARFRLSPSGNHAKAMQLSVPPHLGSAIALIEAMSSPHTHYVSQLTYTKNQQLQLEEPDK